MMRKNITRTMVTSKINAFKMTVENGQPVIENVEPLTVMGKASEKDALRALKNHYGKDVPITVASIETQEDTYEISVDDFIKYATKIEKNSVPAE